MSYDIRTISDFDKEVKALKKRYPSLKADLAALIQQLKQDPTTGIDLGSGIHKVRLAITSKGKGKSAGARVITYNVMISIEEGIIYLVSIYDKSDYASVSVDKIKALIRQHGL